jgi:hypothetical protein
LPWLLRAEDICGCNDWQTASGPYRLIARGCSCGIGGMMPFFVCLMMMMLNNSNKPPGDLEWGIARR